MGVAHTNLLKDIMKSAPANVRLFRNDVGYVESIKGDHITYGLLEGSSDIIGWTTIRGVAVFTGIEGKIKRDKPSDAQLRWRDNVQRAGGIAIVARSIEECWSEHSKAVSDLCARHMDGSDLPYGSFEHERPTVIRMGCPKDSNDPLGGQTVHIDGWGF